MEITPEAATWKSLYKLMIGSILPRPIGWISTVDLKGQYNLAPFSFFNAVCANPPHILFAPNVRGTDGLEKDTVRNIRATGEFVANIVTAPLAQAMNLSSAELPADVDEFKFSGLTPIPSTCVRPPRVAESPIHYECNLTQLIELGSGPGGGCVIIGRVVHLHVDESVLLGEDKIDLTRLQPIGRLAGSSYCKVTDTFEMIRPQSQIKAR